MSDALQLLTVSQTANMLACSERYVRTELIGKGKLKAIQFKPRGQYRVHADSVEKLVNHQLHREKSDSYYQQRAAAAMEKLGWQPPRGNARHAPHNNAE